MKILSRFYSLLLFVRLLRRLVIGIERLVLLYEADLRARDVIVPDPKLIGSEAARVEVSYGSKKGEPEDVQAASFDDYLR